MAKRVLITVLTMVVVLVSCVVPACKGESEQDQFSFGNGVTFGMSTAQVERLQGKPDYVTDEFMAYSGTSAGLDAITFYSFSGGLVDTIFVTFQEKHASNNRYIDDFDEVETAMKAKYGTPFKDREETWSDTLFKGDKEGQGLAIACEHLEITSAWKIGDALVSHSIRGDNYEIVHVIAYIHFGSKKEVDTSGI